MRMETPNGSITVRPFGRVEVVGARTRTAVDVLLRRAREALGIPPEEALVAPVTLRNCVVVGRFRHPQWDAVDVAATLESLADIAGAWKRAPPFTGITGRIAGGGKLIIFPDGTFVVSGMTNIDDATALARIVIQRLMPPLAAKHATEMLTVVLTLVLGPLPPSE